MWEEPEGKEGGRRTLVDVGEPEAEGDELDAVVEGGVSDLGRLPAQGAQRLVRQLLRVICHHLVCERRR